MGNFSRDTFDQTKAYVAVRLQQGVPVLDADWNELNDVIRQEFYDTFRLTFTDGIPPRGFDLEVQGRPEPNDIHILAGAALIQGRPARVRENLRYSTQPWTDPRRAARDGVAVIPPLTTPTGPPGAPPRIDIVYLDVWERGIGSTEDATLINPAIGIETCVRVRREVALRVAEGTTQLPAAPAGHAFLPLALLHRPPNQALIDRTESLRPFLHSPQGARIVSFFPAFLPVHASPLAAEPAIAEWRIAISPVGPNQSIPKFRAVKRQNEAPSGILPLTLPDGARLTSFSIRGDISGNNGIIQWLLLRFRHQVPTLPGANGFFDILAEDTIQATATPHIFDTNYGFGGDESRIIVDNGRYYYALLVHTGMRPDGYMASIHGVSISYEYFGLARRPRMNTSDLSTGHGSGEKGREL